MTKVPTRVSVEAGSTPPACASPPIRYICEKFVVCLPASQKRLIRPSFSLRPGSRRFSRLDFPAPDAP